MITRACSKSPI
jgi:hypothetical protein